LNGAQFVNFWLLGRQIQQDLYTVKEVIFMTLTIGIQAVIRNQSDQLIRAEIRSAEQRKLLEYAVREAITKLGCSIEDISEASGLTPDHIRRVLDAPLDLDDDLAHLAGVR